MKLKAEEIDTALARLGATPDGKVLRHLLLVEIQSTISDTAADGALRALGARRNFATHLLRKLDPQPDPDGRTDASLADPARRTGIPGTRSGARRRVPPESDG